MQHSSGTVRAFNWFAHAKVNHMHAQLRQHVRSHGADRVWCGMMLQVGCQIEHGYAGASPDDAEVHQLSMILTSMLGFATYKVAMIAASLAPEDAAPVHPDTIDRFEKL